MRILIPIFISFLTFFNGYAQETNTGQVSAETKESIEPLELDTTEAKALILEKTKYLENYISLLTSNAKTDKEAREITELALKLFVSDTCKVEVSNIRTDSVYIYIIKTYLSRLKALRSYYDKINIKWVDAMFVTDLRKGPDGRWYGTVSIIQQFEALRDGRIVYKDETTKHLEIVVDEYRIKEMGQEFIRLEIFLSRITVEETVSI